jgi:hypothetical protein
MKDYSADISICNANIYRTKEELVKTNKFINEIEELIILAPPEFKARSAGEIAIDPKENQITLKSLAKLKQELYEKKQSYTITQRKVAELENDAWFLEDILNTIKTKSMEINWTIEPKYKINKKIEYYYYIFVRPYLCKFFAFLFFVVSLFSFLGVFGIKSHFQNTI